MRQKITKQLFKKKIKNNEVHKIAKKKININKQKSRAEKGKNQRKKHTQNNQKYSDNRVGCWLQTFSK